ncbi:MAG: hypothetical protein IKR85_01800 [Clostridia bacterium]|nr:hypothetical protein [Clostridia bacterium]
MKTLIIPPFPEGLGKAGDAEKLRKQGDEPHAACEEGVRLSPCWRVFADGQEVPVYVTPVTRGGPHSFACLRWAGDEKLLIEAESDREITSAEVLPESYAIKAEHSRRRVRFETARTGHVTLLVNGGIEKPLTLSILPVREEKTPAQVRGLYFGPGVHSINVFDFDDGDTIYLADGAVVTALPPPPDEKPTRECDWAKQRNYRTCICAEGKKHLRIEGGGILDFSLLAWHERSPVAFRNCEDVCVRDAALVNAPAWNLCFSGCSNVAAEFVRIFGYRENSDGIDIVSTEQARVDDCFLRTGDDAVVVKAMLLPPRVGGRDIRCRRCVVWNDKVRCLGIAAESRNDISDVYFGDCDVIRSYADWTLELGALVVYISDKAHVSNVVFEDIRIEHEVHLATHVMVTKDFWSRDEAAGSISGVTFRNIKVKPAVGSRLAGYDAEHTVERVTYENYSVAGRRARTPEEAMLEICAHVKDTAVI